MADAAALYSPEIVEHSRSRRNFHVPHGAGFQALEHNALCGESISVCARVGDGIIRDLSFQEAGCAFAMASASMMTVALKGKTVTEASCLVGNLQAHLNGGEEPADLAELGDLAAFAAVREAPTRIPCVLLPWTALLNALPAGPEAGTQARRPAPLARGPQG
ncbi:MAG TPA: SUF system NifU family Fe-S cluster assembly protein [Armatimonadota bacterium]|nr:SUF system NifU family Fe-S cluster assembly protein [Armatimonadota bacterium]